MTTDVVPFGKYRDQPVEMLVRDNRYCEWLLAQDWFKVRYQPLFQIIVSGGAEPQDTPEHNAMQAQFLDPLWFKGIGQIVKGRMKAERYADRSTLEKVFDAEFVDGSVKGGVDNPEFERNGWDVSCQLTIWGMVDVRLIKTVGEIWLNKWEEFPSIKRRQEFVTQERVLLELKPSLSDDYPTVLREMKARRRDSGDHVFLIAREASFQHVTWDQVKAIFETAHMTALLESEIAP